MPHVGIFGPEFQKNYYHILNQHPQTGLIGKFRKKQKNALNLGPKVPYLGIFWAGIWKQNCRILKQYLRICLIATFREKIKMPKFGTKKASCRSFWAKIWITFVIFEITSLKLSNCNISQTKKISKFGTKKTLFGHMPYLKSASWICLVKKFGAKIKFECPDFKYNNIIFKF